MTAGLRPGGLLRQRNFRLLWIGETISGAGNSMAVVGVPLLAVTVLHASTFAVAALTASMRFLAYGMVPLGALLAGALGTALGVRDALWIVQLIFAASGLLLLTPPISAARDLPGYGTSARKAASSAGMSPTNSGGASV